MKAKSYRKNTRRDIRIAKMGNASEVIGKIERDQDVYILTFGQFNLINALTVLLEQTGPAHVDIATWTAATADLDEVTAMLKNADITRLRFIVDRSFLTRKPKTCHILRQKFGDDFIRSGRVHAKFIAIYNKDWKVAVRTSMNLNGNPRLENIEISTDDKLCDFLIQVTDDIFRDNKGDFESGIPSLDTLENIPISGHLSLNLASAGDVTAKELKL